MSNDLISRSALLEEMKKFTVNQRYLISEEIWGMVENAPTAYDVEKVIDWLEKDVELAYKRHMECDSETHPVVRERYATQYQERANCLQIVRTGGVK